MVSRGEIWLARLDPTIGSEIQKTRPCLIVSPETQQNLRTVILAPLTSKGRPAPYRPDVTFQGKEGRILTDQIRAVDRQRLVKRLGVVDAEILSATLAILREAFEE